MTNAAVDSDSLSINIPVADPAPAETVMPPGLQTFLAAVNGGSLTAGQDTGSIAGGSRTGVRSFAAATQMAGMSGSTCAGQPDGTTCDDGDACTQTETCQAGSCQPPSPPYPVVVNLPIDDLGSIGGGNFASEINASGAIVGELLGADGEFHAWRST
jgi:hypothetical protein